MGRRQKNKRTKCLDDKYAFLLETLRASSPVSNNHTYLCFKKQSSSKNCYHQSTPPPLPVPRPLRGGEPSELAGIYMYYSFKQPNGMILTPSGRVYAIFPPVRIIRRSGSRIGICFSFKLCSRMSFFNSRRWLAPSLQENPTF